MTEGRADCGLICWPRLTGGRRAGAGPELGTLLVTQGMASQLPWPEWSERLRGAGKGRGDREFHVTLRAWLFSVGRQDSTVDCQLSWKAGLGLDLEEALDP